MLALDDALPFPWPDGAATSSSAPSTARATSGADRFARFFITSPFVDRARGHEYGGPERYGRGDMLVNYARSARGGRDATQGRPGRGDLAQLQYCAYCPVQTSLF